MVSDGYAYTAVEFIESLTPRLQAEIECLRCRALFRLVATGRARLTRNTPEEEYCFDWADRGLVIEFYLRSTDSEAIIFGIRRATLTGTADASGDFGDHAAASGRNVK